MTKATKNFILYLARSKRYRALADNDLYYFDSKQLFSDVGEGCEHLRHDPIKLCFTIANPTSGLPKSILKRSLNQSIAEIMASSGSNPANTVIMFEKLDVSIVKLETKHSLNLHPGLDDEFRTLVCFDLE